MRSLKLRSLVFQLHRYLGLICGVVLIIIGTTGSLLIFEPELEHQLIEHRIGAIEPQGNPIGIDAILATVRAEVSRTPGLTLGNILTPQDATSPYQARLWDTNEHLVQLFIHPYTGQMMGMIPEVESWLHIALRLHYQLLIGNTGAIVTGMTGLLLCLLSLTGVVLWPGWRKLLAGFKIKWNAHPKRRNFDLHKVAGIIAAVFLAFTGFTGFCWNFYDWSSALIYALTLTPKPPTLIAKPLPGQAALPLSTILQVANTPFPDSLTTYVGVPSKPEGVVRVGKRQTHESLRYGESEILVDPYTGQTLHVQDSKTLGLGDRILNAFVPLHYGTFWGLPSRIFYVFVGLTPLVLFLTGSAMWQSRQRKFR
ncbi:MAG: PepSY-associated TM helix domain-containing protein [Stenomitos frigidus ULC029]